MIKQKKHEWIELEINIWQKNDQIVDAVDVSLTMKMDSCEEDVDEAVYIRGFDINGCWLANCATEKARKRKWELYEGEKLLLRIDYSNKI